MSSLYLFSSLSSIVALEIDSLSFCGILVFASTIPALKNADPLPALARFWIRISVGTATICPNRDVAVFVTLTTFHPEEAASATISRNVLS
jgi:hypothetical protein